METLKRFKTILFSFLLLLIFTSCKDQFEPEFDFFLIDIEEIEMPEIITVKTSFDMKFYGTIGTNGCHKFHEFKTSAKENEITVEVFGKISRTANVCTAVIVPLDGEILNYMIEDKGDYTILVKQPDNSFFEKNISVQ